uniref:Uncharacterized protein n=1 Tax=Glossina palpalis gambiensis TaxID=67801 RepID=A0A1B0BGI0_9MUSC
MNSHSAATAAAPAPAPAPAAASASASASNKESTRHLFIRISMRLFVYSFVRSIVLISALSIETITRTQRKQTICGASLHCKQCK